jgi:hypothetical protein
MTKFEIGMSEIDSISKRLEMAINPSWTASRPDRADSTIQGHSKEKRQRNIQENHPYLHEPRDDLGHHIGQPSRASFAWNEGQD